MSSLKGKIDFTLFVSVRNANPNGDPLNRNMPRTDSRGYGEISDVCIKRKLRNRFQDLGQKIFVQSDDRADDGFESLKARADACEGLTEELKKGKNADEDLCKTVACKEWLDVRAFGQVFAFKGNPVSFSIRGPVTIHKGMSVDPVEIESLQITKSVNSESGVNGKASDTMGMKHMIGFAVYRIMGSISVQLAEKTGFSQEDAEILKTALATMFENDASSARPEGSMDVSRMYWWQHDSKVPQVSSAAIHDAFKITALTDYPMKFSDYDISWHLEGCKDPEII